MMPWVERETLEIDLDEPMARRYDGVPAIAFLLHGPALAGPRWWPRFDV